MSGVPGRKTNRRLSLFLIALFLVAAGCSGPDSTDSVQSVGSCEGKTEVSFDHPYCKAKNEYGDLFCRIYERLATGSIIVDGDDQEDYGDTMAYCCALIYTWEKMGMAEPWELEFAGDLAQCYKRRVDRFRANPLVILLDTNMAMEVYIGVLGLLLAHEAGADPEALQYVDAYFDTMFEITGLFGPLIYSIPIPPYGPTTIMAGLAGMLLHYPLASQGEGRSPERLEQGLAVLAEMDRMVWDESMGGYRYLATDRHSYEYQYSNATTIQALVRAYHLTGDPAFLERAEVVAEGLEVLYSERYGGYFASDESYSRAPHSGEAYIALSGQNYTIFADLLLYQTTGQQVYLDRALGLFDFVRKRLWVEEEDLIYHDIQHGLLADWYCTGCNWQFAYNIVLLDHVQQGIDLLPPAPDLGR